MKVLLLILLIITAVLGRAQQQNLNTDNGEYIPDDSGKYIPDYSGQYIHDDSGRYIHDNLGNYNEKIDPYRHQEDKYRFRNQNLIGSGTSPVKIKINKNAFTTTTTTTHSPPVTRQANTYNPNKEGRWRIIKKVEDVGLDGYHWEYETENKIFAEEDGQLFNVGTQNEAMRAKGYFQYTGPDNVVYKVTYTADENGFVPEGRHLPTPPPIPQPLLKALQDTNQI